MVRIATHEEPARGEPPEARSGRRERSDVVRNRRALLVAARDAFAEVGAEISVKQVAARAGVGVGTAYRHFPTSQDLVAAVVADQFDRLRQRAVELRDSDSPGAALSCWLGEFVDYLGAYRGLARAAMPQILDPDSPYFESCHGLRRAGAALLRDAQRAGTIRKDVDFTALMTLANATALACEQAPPATASIASAVLIDGLTAAARTAGASARRARRSTVRKEK